jgi:ActR/RegA family two-component response regulator
MDLNLPGASGIYVTRRITQALPDTVVLVLTMSEDESILAAIRAGARGYLLKGARQVLELVGNGLCNHAIAQRSGSARRPWLTISRRFSSSFTSKTAPRPSSSPRQAGLAANPGKTRP